MDLTRQLMAETVLAMASGMARAVEMNLVLDRAATIPGMMALGLARTSMTMVDPGTMTATAGLATATTMKTMMATTATMTTTMMMMTMTTMTTIESAGR